MHWVLLMEGVNLAIWVLDMGGFITLPFGFFAHGGVNLTI